MHADGWLFPVQHYLEPLSTRQLHRIVVEAGQAAGMDKRVGPHTLRHCFTTHLLEDGIDVRVIQALLGHARLGTTAFYTKVATRMMRAVTSPLEKILPPRRKGTRRLRSVRTSLEVADNFRSAGPAHRADHAGRISLHQLNSELTVR